MRGLFERFAVVLVVFGVFAALVTTARAGAYEDALPKFTLDSFSDTADAIARHAAIPRNRRSGDNSVPRIASRDSFCARPALPGATPRRPGRA